MSSLPSIVECEKAVSAELDSQLQLIIAPLLAFPDRQGSVSQEENIRRLGLLKAACAKEQGSLDERTQLVARAVKNDVVRTVTITPRSGTLTVVRHGDVIKMAWTVKFACTLTYSYDNKISKHKWSTVKVATSANGVPSDTILYGTGLWAARIGQLDPTQGESSLASVASLRVRRGRTFRRLTLRVRTLAPASHLRKRGI